jgi:hypothetical protein
MAAPDTPSVASLAEELEVDLAQVTLEAAPPDDKAPPDEKPPEAVLEALTIELWPEYDQPA